MLKRTFDFVVAGVAAIILFPVMVTVGGLVRMRLGSPVLFRQERPGRYGLPFTLVKFRTMKDTRDAGGSPLDDEERMTRLGRFLRTTSLDELPELWNVLRGDMSLVGPRPLLMEYLSLYTADQARRHLVRPGLTGWAQVNGRNRLDWESRLRMDVWYVDHQSFLLDLRILARTAGQLVQFREVHAEGHPTMPKMMSTHD